MSYHSIDRIKFKFQVCVPNVQVNALLNDLFLLFEDLKLLWVVSAWHLGAVAANARWGCGVQRVNAPIAVYGLWGLGLCALLFWWFLLAWGTKKKRNKITQKGWQISSNNQSISIVTVRRNRLKASQRLKFLKETVVGTNSAWRLKEWANLELVLQRETSVIERGNYNTENNVTLRPS